MCVCVCVCVCVLGEDLEKYCPGSSRGASRGGHNPEEGSNPSVFPEPEGRSLCARVCVCPGVCLPQVLRGCVCVCVSAHTCVSESLSILGILPGGSICGWWHSPDVHFQVCNELRAHGGSGSVKAGEGVQLDKALPTQDSRPGTGMQGGGAGRAGGSLHHPGQEVSVGEGAGTGSAAGSPQSCPDTLCRVSTAGLNWMGRDGAWTQPHPFHAPPPGPAPHPTPVLRASLLPDGGAGGAQSSVLSRHHSLAPLHPRRLAHPSPRGHSCHADFCH